MGHDHHFLARLERVDQQETELALSLYRDHQLVRELLRSLSLPEGVDRVAVALSDAPDPPLVVLQRDGRFVTCLGAGMRPGRLTVVPRARLDGLMREQRRKLALDTAFATLQRTRKLRDLFLCGAQLTREDVAPMIAVAPVLEGELTRTFLMIVDKVTQLRAPLLRNKRLGSRVDPLLRTFWRGTWASAHVAVLAMQRGGRFAGSLKATLPNQLLPSSLTIHGWLMGNANPYLFALHAMAKTGKTLLADVKHTYRSATNVVGTVDAMLNLAAIGLRHRRERAEILKTVQTSPPNIQRDANAVTLWAFLRNMLRQMFESPEEFARLQRDLGRAMAVKLGATLPSDHPLRFTREEEVPDDLAFPLTLRGDISLLGKEGLRHVLTVLPWVAGVRTEELYLPEKYRVFLRATSFDPKKVSQTIDEQRIPSPPSAPNAAPSRNSPCPCGSGARTKRCCGESVAREGSLVPDYSDEKNRLKPWPV